MTTKKARKPAPKATAAPAAVAEASAPEPASAMVSCVLGPASTVGGLMVGAARIEAKRSGLIPRSDFERLRAEYDLREVGD